MGIPAEPQELIHALGGTAAVAGGIGGILGALIGKLVDYIFQKQRDVRQRKKEMQLKIAEHRQPAYKALWALQEPLSPTSATELSACERQKLNAALVSWYYRDGNGLFLSLHISDRFLRTKKLLLDSQVSDTASRR